MSHSVAIISVAFVWLRKMILKRYTVRMIPRWSFVEKMCLKYIASLSKKMVWSEFTAKRKVDSENRQFEEEWPVKCAPPSIRPMCLICQETIAVMKISNLKQHYEPKHRNFQETFPQNSFIISSCKQDSCHIYDTATKSNRVLTYRLRIQLYSAILICQNGNDILF